MRPFYLRPSISEPNLKMIAMKIEAYDELNAFPDCSYKFFTSHLLGVSYGNFCRYCRDNCGAILIPPKDGHNISVLFPKETELVKNLLKELNNRFEILIK